MRLFGLLLIVIALAIPAYWFAGLAGRHDNGALLSQYFGVAALISMSFVQVFATRVTGLENIFGSMDRIYVLHKWLAILAMLLMVLHDIIDAEMDGLGAETLLSELGETLGEISLYGFLILATLSIATFVPYHLWKFTHKFMGALFAAGAIHFVLIQKPVALTDPLGVYTLAFCVAGVLAYIYTLLPTGMFKGWRGFTVTNIEDTGGALAVTLAPRSRGHRHRAGQFAFVEFDVPNLGEGHPFTISQAPDGQGTIRFTIKDLGDYTAALRDQLTTGTTARVSRPFGHFHVQHGNREQIWIAAGVGITPFVAWSQALKETDGPAHLFFCATSRSAAPHIQELEAIAAAKPNLNLHLIESNISGRLTANQVSSAVNSEKSGVTVAFCGPKPMRETLREQLTTTGFSRSRFRYEEFEIRSGLGLRKLLGWLMSRNQRQSDHAGAPSHT